jgi:quercetin dioxygenase-like cupin family protein
MMNHRQAPGWFGVATVTLLFSEEVVATRKVVVVKLGENRCAYQVASLRTDAACKVTAQDTGVAASIFELVAPSTIGPPRHVHHREDEWYYVLSGDFLFEVGDATYTLSTGATIWAPRKIPHGWANLGTQDARMILPWQPGGFELFFDELARSELKKDTPDQMGKLAAKYGVEVLGPPLFEPPSL